MGNKFNVRDLRGFPPLEERPPYLGYPYHEDAPIGALGAYYGPTCPLGHGLYMDDPRWCVVCNKFVDEIAPRFQRSSVPLSPRLEFLLFGDNPDSIIGEGNSDNNMIAACVAEAGATLTDATPRVIINPYRPHYLRR